MCQQLLCWLEVLITPIFRDAEDAVRGRDGYVFDGYRIRVEFPRASSRGGGSYRRPSGGFRPTNRPRGYQLLVSGLPPTGSWQVRCYPVTHQSTVSVWLTELPAGPKGPFSFGW